MVQFIKKWMKIEGVTIRVVWVPDGAANSGTQEDRPACVFLPPNIPFFDIPQLTPSFLDRLPLAARAQTSRRGMPSGHSENQPATLGNVHKASGSFSNSFQE
jgi:hypothetical protein